MCLDSAKKAYMSLLEDERSGCNITMTQEILNELINKMPLTPITGAEDEWKFFCENEDGSIEYQNIRFPALIKVIHPDEAVHFSDNSRVKCLEIESNKDFPYTNSFITNLVDSMLEYEITMPYKPSRKPIRVYLDKIMVNDNRVKYNIMNILCLYDSFDIMVEIGRYFKENELGTSYVEISEEEYDLLKKRKRNL